MLIRPCCSSAIFEETNSAARATGRYSQYQWRSSTLSVDRSEHVADRLAESIRGVLHSRSLLGITAVPWGREAHAAVVEAPHQEERKQGCRRDDHEKDDGRVARLAGRGRHQPQPARTGERLLGQTLSGQRDADPIEDQEK